MKKVILLLFIAIFGVTLIGCNTNSNTDYNTDEVIAAPTNLVVNGTTLSWDAVDNSKGYNIYVNGEKKTNTKSLTYNFSSLVGTDPIIFKVQTIAPKGFQDSALSVQTAYVPDKANEITKVNTALVSNKINLPQGFAEELVNKGMTATELSKMLGDFQTAISQLGEVNDINGMYGLLTQAMGSITNVEAIVSAIIKNVAPSYLDVSISSIEAQKNILEVYRSQYTQEKYNELMTGYNDQIAQLTAIKTMFTNNPDKAILTVTNTINYFVMIEQSMTQDMVDTINSLTERTGAATLNASDVVVVKDEMVNVFRENLPSLQDTVMMIQFEQSLLSITNSQNDINSQITNYDTKAANKILMSVNIFIDFLDSIDVTFFTEIKTDAASNMTDPLLNAEISILAIKHFAAFKQANQDKFDQIDSVFTADEKELIYQNGISQSEDLLANYQNEINYNPFANMNFNDLLYLSGLMQSSFDILLQNFVATDGQIIRIEVILDSFNGFGTYYNSALDETFTTTEYYEKMDMLKVEANEQIYLLFGSVITNLSQSDYEALAKYFVSLIPFKTMIDGRNLANTISVSDLITATENAILSTSSEQLDFINNIIKFIDDNNVFNQIIAYQNYKNNYMRENYGDKYNDNFVWYTDMQPIYYEMIMVSSNYSAFMTSQNRNLLNDILDSLFTYLKTDDVLQVTGLSLTEVNNVQTNLNNLLDYMTTETNIIKDYDVDNLTTAQTSVLEDFYNNTHEYFNNLNQNPSELPTLN